MSAIVSWTLLGEGWRFGRGASCRWYSAGRYGPRYCKAWLVCLMQGFAAGLNWERELELLSTVAYGSLALSQTQEFRSCGKLWSSSYHSVRSYRFSFSFRIQAMMICSFASSAQVARPGNLQLGTSPFVFRFESRTVSAHV